MVIIAVSGGFDPIHRGHISYLKEAKALGDKLIVIMNSDEFLKRKKGYVFMPYEDRRAIIESIKYVDEVFESVDTDQSVCKSLAQIKPNIFAKGGDRTVSNIPERKVCEDLGIKIVDGVGGIKSQSSSWIIQKYNQNK